MKNLLITRNSFFTVVVAAIICLTTGCSTNNHLVSTASAEDIKAAIDSSHWIFTPNIVRPQYGKTRNANGNYSVQYTPGRLTVYLPYFGRAYGSADLISGRGPLDFSDVEFATSNVQPKPGQWKINIQPKNYNEVQSMNFVFFSNGSATLKVTMTNRSAISYNGIVAPLANGK